MTCPWCLTGGCFVMGQWPAIFWVGNKCMLCPCILRTRPWHALGLSPRQNLHRHQPWCLLLQELQAANPAEEPPAAQDVVWLPPARDMQAIPGGGIRCAVMLPPLDTPSTQRLSIPSQDSNGSSHGSSHGSSSNGSEDGACHPGTPQLMVSDSFASLHKRPALKGADSMDCSTASGADNGVEVHVAIGNRRLMQDEGVTLPTLVGRQHRANWEQPRGSVPRPAACRAHHPCLPACSKWNTAPWLACKHNHARISTAAGQRHYARVGAARHHCSAYGSRWPFGSGVCYCR